MSEPLDTEVVYQNLEWQWTFFGLARLHILLCFAPALLYLWVASWDDAIPQAAALYIFAATLPAIIVLQWRQPPGWVSRMAKRAMLPRHLSHRRHVEQAPFPVTRENLACPPR